MNLRARVADTAWYRLTAHFFVGLFDFGILSDAGSDALQRVLIGIIAALLTFGLLLARVFMSAVSGREGVALAPTPYRAALETLVIGLPMVIVAFATLLVSHSLFPNETDFRVLLGLPVSRRVVFLSKLAALVLFAGVFIVAAHAAMLPLFAIISVGRQVEDGFLVRFAAHMLASLSGSTVVVLAVTGINGALLMAVPRGHVQAASTAVRSAMLCALVLCVPLAARLPTVAPLLAAESPALYLVPPVWFLGVEELLLGHGTPYVARLAGIAAVTWALSTAVSVGSYLLLYRRFDRVMMRPAGPRGAPQRSTTLVMGRARPRRSNLAAIRAFTHLTLARSPLHQGVFIAIAACGAGLVLNSFLGVKALPWLRRGYEDELAAAATWAPFALMFVMTLAVRAAIALPIEPRANWVFRITEHDWTRVQQIDAVVGSMVRLGVVVPLAILFPIEWAVFGSRALAAAAVTFMAGVVLVELEMSEWRRIPFTCSYIPGKRFVGLTALIGLAAFVAVTTIGSLLVWYGRGDPIGCLLAMAMPGAVAWQRRRRRARLTEHTPLIFEDALPNEVEPLRLSAY